MFNPVKIFAIDRVYLLVEFFEQLKLKIKGKFLQERLISDSFFQSSINSLAKVEIRPLLNWVLKKFERKVRPSRMNIFINYLGKTLYKDKFNIPLCTFLHYPAMTTEKLNALLSEFIKEGSRLNECPFFGCLWKRDLVWSALLLDNLFFFWLNPSLYLSYKLFPAQITLRGDSKYVEESWHVHSI